MWLGFLLLCVSAFAEPIHKVVKVKVENSKHIEIIQELQNNEEVKFWTENDPAVGSAMFSIPESVYESVKSKLQTEGMQPITVIEDLQSAVSKEKAENQPTLVERRGLESFDHSRYLTIFEIYNYLESLTNQRSNAHLINIGSTYENRTIAGVRITSGNSRSKPVVFIECGIHAREWVSPAACLYMIDKLSEPQNSETKALVNEYEWYVIPSSNPDGYVYTWSGQIASRVWRKTRSRSSKCKSCVGADANRNFNSNFGGVGTSTNPSNDLYCGDYAFSEKESRALRDILLQLGSRVKAYFSIHSYSQYWMYPWGYTDRQVPNVQKLHDLSKIAVDAIEEVHGKQFKYGSIPDVIYKASGSSVDWVYDTLGTKVAFALELRDEGQYGFMLPKEQIVPTGEETLAGILAVINAL